MSSPASDRAAAVPLGGTVVLIGGYGRSGSTLLDRLLGQLDGFVSVGEFYWVWQWGLLENQRCGCGEAFRSCPFWRAVFERAFGGIERVDAARVLALQRASEGRRYGLQALLHPRAPALAEYRAVLARLYAAVLEVAAARVVVDSTKFAARGFVLRRLGAPRLEVVHLVRDSRAVANSWQRTRERPEITRGRALMPRRRPPRTAAAWTAANLAMELLRRLESSAPPLRYEDLTRDPASALAGIAARLGEPAPELGFLRAGAAELAVGHTVAGNPMRFATGRVAVAPDLDWQTAMRPRDRALVTALTLPLLLRYGYRP